jgi:hypothetical protein
MVPVVILGEMKSGDLRMSPKAAKGSVQLANGPQKC